MGFDFLGERGGTGKNFIEIYLAVRKRKSYFSVFFA